MLKMNLWNKYERLFFCWLILLCSIYGFLLSPYLLSESFFLQYNNLLNNSSGLVLCSKLLFVRCDEILRKKQKVNWTNMKPLACSGSYFLFCFVFWRHTKVTTWKVVVALFNSNNKAMRTIIIINIFNSVVHRSLVTTTKCMRNAMLGRCRQSGARCWIWVTRHFRFGCSWPSSLQCSVRRWDSFWTRTRQDWLQMLAFWM